MRELWQVVAEDYGLHQSRRNFLSSISMVDEKDHVLVFMVELQAIVKLVYAEDSASCDVRADEDVRWQLERRPDPLTEEVKAFRQLENQVEAHEALREYSQAVAVDIDGLTECNHVFLKGVDDLLSEHIGIPFTTLDNSL